MIVKKDSAISYQGYQKRESNAAAAAADGITVMSYYDDAYFDHILNRY